MKSLLLVVGSALVIFGLRPTPIFEVPGGQDPIDLLISVFGVWTIAIALLLD